MGMTATAAKPRRTQAERSAATRQQLVEATIACLSELGYARTTTTEIAERAGVSRGAQLHHFPTKSELVIAAVEQLFANRHEEFTRAIAALPPGTDRATAALDLLWSMVSGPTFYAWLELTVAARTDRDLEPRVVVLNERFIATVQQTFEQLFPPPAEPNPFYAVAPNFVFALLQGLALQKLHTEDADRFSTVLDALKGLAHLAVPARAS